eukprot:m.245126 g.245126  ORF g.245126 m.245126 type:complete len:256 (+) comp15359_c0_seq2:347-1114(+)
MELVSDDGGLTQVEEGTLFICEFEFEPELDDELLVKPGDFVTIQRNIAAPEDQGLWLTGRNLSTNLIGMFPREGFCRRATQEEQAKAPPTKTAASGDAVDVSAPLPSGFGGESSDDDDNDGADPGQGAGHGDGGYITVVPEPSSSSLDTSSTVDTRTFFGKESAPSNGADRVHHRGDHGDDSLASPLPLDSLSSPSPLGQHGRRVLVRTETEDGEVQEVEVVLRKKSKRSKPTPDTAAATTTTTTPDACKGRSRS